MKVKLRREHSQRGRIFRGVPVLSAHHGSQITLNVAPGRIGRVHGTGQNGKPVARNALQNQSAPVCKLPLKLRKHIPRIQVGVHWFDVFDELYWLPNGGKNWS